MPGYSLDDSACGHPSQWSVSSVRDSRTIRRTGAAMAATSRPWYLRVFRQGMVDDA
ncbi:MAG: hypothetical protein AVDCRST_MAG40-1833 [uncultured Gemmatimonadaceae bacterium]|uniref:Uncharacterized protein n=1 Tax=uncultured Gemmatimonadaceae bacterium TaxID=246130 RepID=A0A6J4LDM0_9BACT|nr:MAG: hypothetical protein AVDCRST_MAG40-1833 [uncultured Gemmatimonadaceae bacterium]